MAKRLYACDYATTDEKDLQYFNKKIRSKKRFVSLSDEPDEFPLKHFKDLMFHNTYVPFDHCKHKDEIVKHLEYFTDKDKK